jgi:hypothetical protein
MYVFTKLVARSTLRLMNGISVITFLEKIGKMPVRCNGRNHFSIKNDGVIFATNQSTCMILVLTY